MKKLTTILLVLLFSIQGFSQTKLKRTIIEADTLTVNYRAYVPAAIKLTQAVNLGQLVDSISGYVDLTTNQTINGVKTFNNRVSQTGLGGSTFFGLDAGFNFNPVYITENTGYGIRALYKNTIGSNNVANGGYSLSANTIGNNNTANGGYSLLSNVDGNDNTATGAYSLVANTGSYNTATGIYSLRSKNIGDYNVADGYEAGDLLANGSSGNYITRNSVFIGAKTKALADDQTNQIVIGYDATSLGSNTVVLGNTSIIKTQLRGTVHSAALVTDLDQLTTKLYVDARVGSTLSGTLNTIPFYNTTSSLGDSPLSVNANGTGIQQGTSVASSSTSAAFGKATLASGWYSLASGYTSTASGIGSTASGSGSLASGEYSTASGISSTASGYGSDASGIGSTASGIGSTASGEYSTASGEYSTASGFYTKAESQNSTTICRFNIGGGSATTWIATDPLFEIGNGESELLRANALTVLKNGNTTIIGTLATTQYKLSALNTAPASATATGTLGEIRITADFIYICISTDVWMRAPLVTW